MNKYGKENSFVLKVNADIGYMPPMRDLVLRMALHEKFDPSEAQMISIAFEEAFTNIVEHAYDDQAEQSIRLGLWVEKGYLVFSLEDDGRHYNPLARPDVDMEKYREEMREGGLGIHMVKKIMDLVEYEALDKKGNLLTLRKKIPV